MLVVKHILTAALSVIFFLRRAEKVHLPNVMDMLVCRMLIHISVPAMLRKLLCVFVSITQCVG